LVPSLRDKVVIRTTIISPGSIDTEITEGISGLELKSAIDEDMKIAIGPASIARTIRFAIEQPSDVAIKEVLANKPKCTGCYGKSVYFGLF
jgi:NADP-dependent 3-hydroxy acid dehydrogenase YdfG